MKKVLSIATVAAMAINIATVPVNVFAEELPQQIITTAEVNPTYKASVSKFSLQSEALLNAYNAEFKLDNAKIESIANNGGKYAGSNIERAIDGDLTTHWETGQANSAEFSNEVEFTFTNPVELNRIVYAPRVSGAPGKGAPQAFEIYATTEGSEDYTLVTSGEYAGNANDILEIQFDATEFKQLKFVFTAVNQGMAAASEFMFYKEDPVRDSINSLFTDHTFSQVSAEFNTIEALTVLEQAVHSHPLKELFIETIENAKLLVTPEKITATTAKVASLAGYGTEVEAAYDAIYRMPNANVQNITTNAGSYPGTKLEYMLDEDPLTHWETTITNNAEFKNELVFDFEEATVLDRVGFLARSGNQKGFPEEFEIYASATTVGDTFQLVATGTATTTSEFVQFQFEPTNFKRLKFKFKKSNLEDRPYAAEFRFYKEDAIQNKMDNLFADDTMAVLNADYSTIEQIDALEAEVKAHPLYETYKEALQNAKLLVTQEAITATTAKAAPLSGYGTAFETAYDAVYRMPNVNVKNIRTNAGSYPGTKPEFMLDEDPLTHWETSKTNNAEFKNELVFEFEEATVLDRVGFLARSGNQKGFPEEFEIYASATTVGDTFQLVATGTATTTSEFVQFQFEPTNFKRLKFKFKKSNLEDRPYAAEFRFYKEDAIQNKMDNLFADDTMAVLNADYSTIEQINALEAEVKVHPLYETYKETLQNAKLVVTQEKITATTAKVAPLSGYGTEVETAYNELFRMPNTNVNNITSNAGSYPGTKLEYMLDEDPLTHWETTITNNAEFKNELVFEFEEATVLDRVGFLARSGNQKGFPEEFEVYASTTTAGETFQLVATGTATKASAFVQFQFEPTNFKRLKFKFKKSYMDDRPYAAEFRFYKEDVTQNKLENLFVDDALATVNPDYNTIEKITALEAEAQAHPLYEIYKETLENAKLLVTQGEITPTTASVAQLVSYGTDFEAAYDDVYRMPNANVKNILTNAGSYPGTKPEFMLDEDPLTHWETSKTNNAEFKNELVFEFEEAAVLDRIGFLARSGNQKGFPEEFEVYASTTTVGETFQLVATGSAVTRGDFVQFKFEPTMFKRLKFKFVKSYSNDRPYAAEFRFYKEDATQSKMDELFVDNTRTAVSANYNTIEKVNALEAEFKTHPLYEIYKEQFEIAKKIVNGELSTEGRVIVAEQHGNMVNYSNQVLKMPYGNNNQPTGIAAKAGETITVYVEAAANQPLPMLTFTQHEGSYNKWTSTVNLKPGKNELIVPTIYEGNVTQGGPVYIVNPYTAEEQPQAPVIRFEGGERFPIFMKDTNVEEFKAFLTDYQNRLTADIAAHPDVKGRELIDVVEIVSDRIVFTGLASSAYDQYITNNLDPAATVNGYDVWINSVFEFSGLDGSSEEHDPKYVRENIRLMQPFGAAYAAHNHTGIQRGAVPSMFNDFSVTYPGWGLTHEIGHRMAVAVREYGEVTNNMVSMAMSVTYDHLDNRIPFEKMYGYLIKENDSTMSTLRLEERLAAFWQLELAHPGYWAKLNDLYRERPVTLTDGDLTKQQYLIQFSSEVLKQDLSSYFARHGYTVTAETKEFVSQYPASNKIWYLNNSLVGYTASGFTGNPSITADLTANPADSTNTLTISIDEANEEHVLGYEIIRNGTVIGFTSTSTFVDKNVDMNENYTYEVIAYDKKLNSTNAVEMNASIQ